MITPLFDVSQDDDFVVLVIRVPYMKASTFDYYIIGPEFKFYAKPYFLRLTFPHALAEDGKEKLAYDISNGILTVHLPKATHGQFFENLGMITQLLAKKKPTMPTAPVQVMASGEEGPAEEFEEEEEEIDMEVEQTAAPEVTSEIVELPFPDTTPAADRRELRILAEDARFDPEHYMADFVIDDTIKELMRFEPHWVREKKKYRELKRQYLNEKKEKDDKEGGAQKTDDAADVTDMSNKTEDEKEDEGKQMAVEALDVRPSSSAPRVIMLMTNREKEEEERKAATKKNESGAGANLQPFPFRPAGSRPLVQEIGPGDRYRPVGGSTLRPLIQEIPTSANEKAGGEDEDGEDEIIDVAREMKAVSIKRITADQPRSTSSSSSSSSAPVQLQLQPKSASSSIPSGFLLSSSSSSLSDSSSSTSPSSSASSSVASPLIMEVDPKKESVPVVVQQQPSNPLPTEVINAAVSGPKPSPFASISFDVPSPHQTGPAFPFSPVPSSSTASTPSDLPTSPFVFSSSAVPPSLVFGASTPSTPSTPTPSAAPSESVDRRFLVKPSPPAGATKAAGGNSQLDSSNNKRRQGTKRKPTKSKEELKEDMKMRISVEEKVIEWTQDEKEAMLRLPRKEFLLENEKATLLGLIDIVFTYAYNQRTTMDEPTCESDWTITFLSPTMSWLETFGGVGQTLVACVRRSITYPLYRHWGLSQLVLKDVVTIFSMGKRSVLRALLGVKRILDRSDPRFYHCKLFIDDYCVWLQSYRLRSVYGLLKQAVELFDKEDVEWPLDELEREAPQVVMDVEADDGDHERPQGC